MSSSYALILFISTMYIYSPTKVYGETIGVNWLEDGEKLISGPFSRRTLSIFCYKAKSTKSVLQFWQSAMFHLDINDTNFNQHIGNSPAEVQLSHKDDTSIWSVGIFGSRQKINTLKLDIFNDTCMGIDSNQRYSVRLQVVYIDYRKVITTIVGITLIILSKTLSENALFFYICGISVGILASFLVLVYFLSRLFPKKPLMYGMLAGGWAVGLYLLQIVYENIAFYKMYLGWYSLLTGFISFMICYKVGPPTDIKSKNLIMWMIQILGSISLYFSSEFKEAAVGLAVLCLLFKYFPQRWLNFIIGYWYIKFPHPRKFLSDEEYFAEGARETRKALQELRDHCNSPDCAQWKTMLKINEPKRFASFIEGDSHLSDDEILDYETYAFSAESSFSKHRTPTNSQNRQVNGHRASRRISMKNTSLNDHVSNHQNGEILSSDDSSLSDGD